MSRHRLNVRPIRLKAVLKAIVVVCACLAVNASAVSIRIDGRTYFDVVAERVEGDRVTIRFSGVIRTSRLNETLRSDRKVIFSGGIGTFGLDEMLRYDRKVLLEQLSLPPDYLEKYRAAEAQKQRDGEEVKRRQDADLLSKGYKLIDGRWVSPSEITQWKARKETHVEQSQQSVVGSDAPSWWLSVGVTALLVGIICIFIIGIPLLIYLTPWNQKRLRERQAKEQISNTGSKIVRNAEKSLTNLAGMSSGDASDSYWPHSRIALRVALCIVWTLIWLLGSGYVVGALRNINFSLARVLGITLSSWTYGAGIVAYLYLLYSGFRWIATKTSSASCPSLTHSSACGDIDRKSVGVMSMGLFTRTSDHEKSVRQLCTECVELYIDTLKSGHLDMQRPDSLFRHMMLCLSFVHAHLARGMTDPDGVINESAIRIVKMSLADRVLYFGDTVDPQDAANRGAALLQTNLHRWSSYISAATAGDSITAFAIACTMLRDVETSMPSDPTTAERLLPAVMMLMRAAHKWKQ